MRAEYRLTSLEGFDTLSFGPSYYFEGADFGEPRKRGSSRFGGNYVSLPDRLDRLGSLHLQSPLECLLLRWEAARRRHIGGGVPDDLLEAINKPQHTRMLVVYFATRRGLFAAFDDSPQAYVLLERAAELEPVHRRSSYFSTDQAPWIRDLLKRAKQEKRIVRMPVGQEDYHSRLPFTLSVEGWPSEFSKNNFCRAIFGRATRLYEDLEREYGKDQEIGLLIAWSGGLEWRAKDSGLNVVEIHNVILGGLEDSGLPVNVTASKPKNLYGLSMVNAAAFVRDRGCFRGVRNPKDFRAYNEPLKRALRPRLSSREPLVEVLPPESRAGLDARLIRS